jgi:D-aminopeptidase
MDLLESPKILEACSLVASSNSCAFQRGWKKIRTQTSATCCASQVYDSVCFHCEAAVVNPLPFLTQKDSGAISFACEDFLGTFKIFHSILALASTRRDENFGYIFCSQFQGL